MDVVQRGRASRRRLAVGLSVIASVGGGALEPAAAQGAPGDHFTCRASAVRVTVPAGVGLPPAEPTVANAANDQCANDTATTASAPGALGAVLSTGAETAATTVDATSASAQADVANPSVLPLLLGGVAASELAASSSYQCVSGSPVQQSSTQVTGLTAPGVAPLTTAQPQSLHLAGLADVTLNDTIATATSVTRRAATLTLLAPLLGGVQIVFGEATVGVVGNPCPAPPPPPPPPPSPPSTDPPAATTADSSLRAPVIDDAPPASTPLADATFLYHAVDQGVTLACRLDAHAWTPCNGRSAYAGLAVGARCFAVREQRGSDVGPAAQHCWTIVPLPPGCTASYHHGYFINAGSATLGRHEVVFHATTLAVAGRIAIATRAPRGVLRRIAYRLDGRALGRRARLVLPYARLDRATLHTLRIDVAGARGRAQLVRSFRYVSYVTLGCEGRRIVGRIASRTVRVGGLRVRVQVLVPREVRGTTKLRFLVRPLARHALRRARFSVDGRALRQHDRSAALTAGMLKPDGMQTLTVRLVPPHGDSVTVRIAFRTRRT